MLQKALLFLPSLEQHSGNSVKKVPSSRGCSAMAALRMYSFLSNLSLKTSSDGWCGIPGQPPSLLTHSHNKFFPILFLKFPANRNSCFSVDVKNV